MSRLYQSRLVNCPYNRARQLLEETLAPAVASERPEPLRLRMPLVAGAGELERDVAVSYSRGSDPMHFDQPWKVHWQPIGGGPYPVFEGTLTVRADEDYDTCSVELQGHYDPPLGAAGKLFDAVAGARIANATAREFLRSVGEALETRHRAEEGRKVALRAAEEESPP